LARALATKPQVLLLDEFLDGLDKRAANAALEILENLTQNGVAMVLTTHRPARLPGFIGKAALMNGGRIVKTGPPESLNPARKNTPAFDKIHAPVHQDGAPDFLVRIKSASVRRKGVDVLKNVDLTVRPGGHLAILGPNGSGKSTLLLLMMAALRPLPGGTVEWFGQKGPVDVFEIRKRIGYVSPEMQATYSYDVSALELVLSGFDASIGLYREPGGRELDRAKDLMALAGLGDIHGQRIRSLSYGQLRRLLVARALAPQPDLLLLDEAASGLDPAARTGLLKVLEHAAASGVSLVMTTHHEDELPSCVTRAMTLEDGRLHPHQEKPA
jgi:molybdate transport system ATP-binding protein